MMPVETEHMQAIYSDPVASASAYASLEPWNFSSQLLARIPEHMVVLAVDDVSWSDWGTPEAIQRSLLQVELPPPWFLHQLEPTASVAA